MPESKTKKRNKIFEDIEQGIYDTKIIYMSPEKLSLSSKTKDLINNLYEK